MACNEINITFPEAFGTPTVMPAQNSYLAAFPPHVLTLTRIDGVMQASRAIGRGAQADEALKHLFEEFADVGRYDAILVADPHDRSKGSLFQHVIRPYSTITFMKSSLRLREPTHKFS
jgi:hypothetical protein